MCAALFGLMAVCSTIAFAFAFGARSSIAWVAWGLTPVPVQGVRPQWHDSRDEGDAIEIDVQVSVRRGLDACDAVDRAQRRGDLLGDRAGRLAQPARQLEGDGRREVAQLALGRIFNRQLRQRVGRQLIQVLERRQQPFPQAFVNWKNHEG